MALEESAEDRELLPLASRNNNYSYGTCGVPAARTRRADDPGGVVVTEEHKVEPDDSVFSLAVRHGVSASELRRANGIVSDQEIHAKKRVRVPTVRKDGETKSDKAGPASLEVQQDEEEENESGEDFFSSFDRRVRVNRKNLKDSIKRSEENNPGLKEFDLFEFPED